MWYVASIIVTRGCSSKVCGTEFLSAMLLFFVMYHDIICSGVHAINNKLRLRVTCQFVMCNATTVYRVLNIQ